MPESSTSTRGARSWRRAGSRPSNRWGGSTRWSSTEMRVHHRARRSGSGRKVTCSGLAVTKKPGRRSRSSNSMAMRRCYGSLLTVVGGQARSFDEGLAAWGEAVAHLEALGETEVLELADVVLERQRLPPEAGGEVGGARRPAARRSRPRSRASTGRSCWRGRAGRGGGRSQTRSVGERSAVAASTERGSGSSTTWKAMRYTGSPGSPGSWPTSVAASGKPARRASALVILRRVDLADGVDLDHHAPDDAVAGPVPVAGDHLLALPPPERHRHRPVGDERPEAGLEQHPARLRAPDARRSALRQVGGETHLDAVRVEAEHLGAGGVGARRARWWPGRTPRARGAPGTCPTRAGVRRGPPRLRCSRSTRRRGRRRRRRTRRDDSRRGGRPSRVNGEW